MQLKVDATPYNQQVAAYNQALIFLDEPIR